MLKNFVAIAEKPSVARQIASAFKNRKNAKHWIEVSDPEMGTGWVTWAFGHLFQIDTKEHLKGDVRTQITKGEIAAPERFKLVPRDRNCAAHFKALKQLLSRAECVVNVGDPGREGELIVREILAMAGWKKWNRTYRLWTSLSLTPDVVRKEWKKLKPGNEFDSLYASALARQHADWIFGINASIALQTKMNAKWASLGRVQTPTLGMVVRRYLENKNFKPETYYIVKAFHQKDGVKFSSLLQVPEGKRLKEAEADAVLAELSNVSQFTVISYQTKTVKKFSPPLYSLTELQKDASKKFGFPAAKTLNIAQSLYEKHKCLSYPRTDSRYLGEGNRNLVKAVFKRLGREDLIPVVGKVGKRVFNDAKLTDHHALIPLNKPPAGLTEDEKKVYDLVLARFIAVFLPPQVLEITELVMDAGKHKFVAKGQKVVSPGWTVVYGGEEKDSKDEEKQQLPSFEKGEKVTVLELRKERKQTQPPPLFTEGMLIDTMKKIGIGTPATRASIIETLKKRRYVFVSKGKLIPTELGMKLISELGGCEFASPDMTAKWEEALNEIYEKNKKWNGYKVFIQGIKDYTRKAVAEVLAANIEPIPEPSARPRRGMKRGGKRAKAGKRR